MSSLCWPSPPPRPPQLRRRRELPSAMDSLQDTPSSSPFLSSSPLPTPRFDWHPAARVDAPDVAICDQKDEFWPCHAHTETEHLFPSRQRPLPSLMSKFAAHDLPLSYSPPPSSSVLPAVYCFPQPDSAVADGCEEYDLESMDIHIHETYFATSAERGRWLSSPIVPRVRTQAPPPMRGHSSPAKRPSGPSPTRGRSRKRARLDPSHQREARSFSEDIDTRRCFSPLPPSSPPMSPMSTLSSLGDDFVDSVGDPRSNSVDCRSRSGTPELSISSTLCTSPAEPVCTLALPETTIAIHPTNLTVTSSPSLISRHMSSHLSHSPRLIDVHIQTLGGTNLEPDNVLSPLSQFESDPVEEEPTKLPLSDTVNRSYPRQQINQSVELHVPPHAFRGSCPNNKPPTGNLGVKRAKKRTADRIVNVSSDAKKRRGARSRHKDSDRSSKKTEPFNGPERHGPKAVSRVSEVEVKEQSNSSYPTPGMGTSPLDSKPAKVMGRAESQQPPAAPVSTDVVIGELHASLTGMLIEAFATSRATSMDSSALCSVLTQAHPHLVAERSKEALLAAIAAVLEAGRVRCGMFDKVDSSSERSRHKELENRWFYVPERDEDRERASLISAIMPRQKRNETKKYKQYYYRPLDKICRWDPEDAP